MKLTIANPSFVALRSRPAQRQRGVVLLITLVSLVVLLLAAASLTRSVDTAGTIAGNMAFKFSTIGSADNAMFQGNGVGAVQQLVAASGAAGSAVWTNPAHALNGNFPGYFASMDLNSDGMEDFNGAPQNLMTPAGWNAVSVPFNGGAMDAAGNAASYVIQRMCRGATGVQPTAADCLTNTGISAGGNSSKGNSGNDPPIELSGTNLVYRITVRIIGPRNTVSYVQAFVY